MPGIRGRYRPRAFVALGVPFLAAALFHIVAMIRPAVASGDTLARHVLFVAVNAAVFAGLLVRTRWFVWVFAILVLQQEFSHGHDLLGAARMGANEMRALAAMIYCPVVFVSLLWDGRCGARRGRELRGPSP